MEELAGMPRSRVLYVEDCYTGIAVQVAGGGVAWLVATMIPDSPPLARLLKNLRERAGVTVADLAERSGLAESAIYKAERGSRTVRWRTLETGYLIFCQTPDEAAELLALWAISQCEPPMEMAAVRSAVAAETKRLGAAHVALLENVAALPAEQLRVLGEFVGMYRKSAATRDLVAAWMSAVREG